MATEASAGGLILAAVGSALAAGGLGGPLDFPLGDFGWATFFAMIGALGRAALDAKAARDAARGVGVAAGNLPGLDLVSLAYAAFGAPLVGGLALFGVRAVGFVPDWGAAPVIMGAGYMGRDGVNYAIGLARDIVNRKSGGP